jgi:signal transduction histidine kinase
MGTAERSLYLAIIIVVLFLISLLAIFFYLLYQKQKKLVLLEQRSGTTELMKAEQERQEIATILHNDVVPYLAGIKLRLGLIQEVHPEISSSCIPGIERSIEIVRSLSKKISPMGMFDENFMKGIAHYITLIGIDKTMKVELNEHHEYKIDKEKNMLLFRLLQEVVLNSFKHSKANHLKIETSLDNGDLLIRTSDNGIGFFLDTTSVNTGMGLRLIMSIIDSLGGTMAKSGKEISGTRYNFRLPYIHEK